MTNIAVTSDLHGYLPEIKRCDILLICGDIMPLEIQRDFYKSEFWMRSTFAEWIVNLPCDQVIMVGGNHDYYLEAIENDDIKKYESLYRATRNKLEVLYNKECVVSSKDGDIIKIWGTPYCQEFGNWYFNKSPEELKEAYSSMPKGCDIVISHDPPKVGKYGTILEGSRKGKNCGNPYLAKEIKEKVPRYCFAGHIHSADHNLGTYKGYGITQFANVSYLDESYDPTYNILYLSI